MTPFHFGIGVLGKGLAPARISLTAFVGSQVVIDLESAYFLFIAREWPVHRLMHTFVVASAVGAATGVACWAVGRCLRRSRRGELLADLAWWPSLVGGLVGGATHPLLDGIMHSDIQPLRPFSAANPLLGWIGVGALHLLCVVAAAVGVGLLALRASSHRDDAPPPEAC